MKPIKYLLTLAIVTLAALTPASSLAHCDGLDGPVVKTAQKALTSGDVNLVLIWVQKDDEAEIKKAFEKTLAVRKLSPEAKELADTYFFETVVRVHRAGEGAPFTGLKPAGRDLGPAIPAADKAIEAGKIEPVVKLLTRAAEEGVRDRFKEVQAKKNFSKDDVQAGREYVKAYVEFIHYVERVHDSTGSASHGHSEESAHAAKHNDAH